MIQAVIVFFLAFVVVEIATHQPSFHPAQLPPKVTARAVGNDWRPTPIYRDRSELLPCGHVEDGGMYDGRYIPFVRCQIKASVLNAAIHEVQED